MLYPSIKAIYKNKYAYIYVSDEIKIGGNIYRLLFIGRVEDGCIYDTVILPSAKYKQDKNMFAIYHTDGEPEVFYIVDNNTP